MGLDLIPIGKAKRGSEQAWDKAMETLYQGKPESGEQLAARLSVSILPYETIDAPRVGESKQADDWMLANRDAENSKLSDGEYLELNKGFYVVDLLLGQCDGVPGYSNGGAYEGVDSTSFRGAFLELCVNYLDSQSISRAFTTVMRPDEAVAYGEFLSQIASQNKVIEPKKPFLGGIFSRKPAALEKAEQIEILKAAAKWYVFWGKRGHPIWAYF